ncbi:larval cuticle protein A2B [Drosophila persimilis]|uniref:larval cuticle protein A2B n=1 Tax=Drosophila persimilis TaxID=7234 RepID=UPI000F096658|nr:larval cuticle protein A2B [Drosophila persimilis]
MLDSGRQQARPRMMEKGDRGPGEIRDNHRRRFSTNHRSPSAPLQLLSLFILGVGAAAAIELPLSPIYHSPGLVKPLLKAVEVEAPAHYDFAYSVHDEHTGDIKSQTESRKGDQVQGQYTLIDADGYLRTVDYTSDAHNGFNAVVRRDPLGHKVIKAAPIAKVLSPLPLAYGAPKLLAAPKLPLGLYQ